MGLRALTILSSASAGALLTLSKAVVGDARLRLPGPQLVRGVSKDVTNDEVMVARDHAAPLSAVPRGERRERRHVAGGRGGGWRVAQ